MFMLFAWDDWYPNGGWNDYRGAFPTREEAEAAGKALLEASGADAYQVVNVEGLDAGPVRRS